MSDEHVWEHKRISVWRGAGTCLCVGCIICDNCKYLDVKLCIFIIWRPTYIWINIAQLRRDFTCHNKLMHSDTNGKNWLTVIGNVGHNSTLACAEMQSCLTPTLVSNTAEADSPCVPAYYSKQNSHWHRKCGDISAALWWRIARDGLEHVVAIIAAVEYVWEPVPRTE